MPEVNRGRHVSKAITYLGTHRQSEYSRIIHAKSILQLAESRLNNFVEFHTRRHGLEDNSIKFLYLLEVDTHMRSSGYSCIHNDAWAPTT